MANVQANGPTRGWDGKHVLTPAQIIDRSKARPGDTANRFCPPIYLRPAALQTFLGSRRPGRNAKGSMRAAARTVTLKTTEGVRLAGSLSKLPGKASRGLVILLHGWLGSSESAYVLSTGQYLFDHGFDVLRLNLRDHGNTQHLNSGLFYATRIDEVVGAVITAARAAKGAPLFLAGFSLGGNFALRVARQWDREATKGLDLRGVMAVSPVLDPSKATDAIDGHRSIQYYFLHKWQKTLRIKQKCFPQHYDFSDIIALKNVRHSTELLLRRYSHYPNAERYFADYALLGNALQTVATPTWMVTSTDDPIICVDDFYDLSPNPYVQLVVQPHGGHNGFIADLRGRTWYQEYMLQMFSTAAQ